MRLIDADALIAKCGNWYVEEGTEEGFISDLKHLIDLQPTIEERKTGTWNRYYRMHSGSAFVCNRCGSCFTVIQGENEMNFCPNCGSCNVGESEAHE